MAKKLNYEELKEIWYKKLEKSGFEDIEDKQGRLKEWSSTLVGNRNRVLYQNGGWQAKAEYYRLASHFLNDYSFKNKLEAAIWEYHSNGISVVNIAKLLKKVKLIKTKKAPHMYVWGVVKELRATMYKMYLSQDE